MMGRPESAGEGIAAGGADGSVVPELPFFVDFTVDLEDIVAWQKHHLRNQPTVVSVTRAGRFLLPVATIGVGSVVGALGAGVAAPVLGLGLAAVWIWNWPSVSERVLDKQVRGHAAAKPPVRLLGQFRFGVESEGLRLEAADGRVQQVPWARVGKVHEVDGRAFIEVGEHAAFILPRSLQADLRFEVLRRFQGRR
jgi:hypothetical protein